MIKNLVSIIIVNLNGKQHLEKCLPSIFSQIHKSIEVILVDNASSDDSVGWVKRNYPNVKIVINDQNLGFCQANDIGYNHSKGKYILFLNNDTQVTRHFLVNLIKVIKAENNIGGVQSKILFMDDPKRLDSAGSYLTRTGFLYHYGLYALDAEEFENKFDVFSAKGACMMFRREVLEKVKVDGEIFDQRYFAYFEETDLCHRVWLAGYRVVFVPDSVIYHKFGATSQKLDKSFVEYHSYKNRLNSYLKNLGLTTLVIIIPIHLLICCVLSIVFFLKGKPSITIAIIKAIFWNIFQIRKTLNKRYKIQQAIRKLRDEDFWPDILRNPPFGYYLSQLAGWNTTRIDEEVNV